MKTMGPCKYWNEVTSKIDKLKEHERGVQGKMRKLGVKPGKPNCGIVSMAYLMDLPVSTVWNKYKSKFVKGGNWQGRTSDFNRYQMLKSHFGPGRLYIKGPHSLRSKTLGTWLKREADPNKRYEVTTTKHAMAYDKGVLLDQSGVCTEWGTKSRTKLRGVVEIND